MLVETIFIQFKRIYKVGFIIELNRSTTLNSFPMRDCILSQSSTKSKRKNNNENSYNIVKTDAQTKSRHSARRVYTTLTFIFILGVDFLAISYLTFCYSLNLLAIQFRHSHLLINQIVFSFCHIIFRFYRLMFAVLWGLSYIYICMKSKTIFMPCHSHLLIPYTISNIHHMSHSLSYFVHVSMCSGGLLFIECLVWYI